MWKPLRFFFSGLLMGTAELIPGLSSGTVALLLGIYRQLLGTLHALRPHTLQLLLRGKIQATWHQLHGPFILPLLCGIATSLLFLACPIVRIWQHHPLLMKGFLLGVTLAAMLLMLNQFQHHRPSQLFWVLLGFLLLYSLTKLQPLHISTHPLILCLSGGLASCAMLLPGISGSYVLLLLGQYLTVLRALANWNWSVLLPFSTGCLFGLVGCARGISLGLRHHHDAALAWLIGGMLGALHRLWPWQHLATHSGAVSRLFMPMTYQAVLEQDAQVLPVLCCMSIGFLLPLLCIDLTPQGTSSKPSVVP